MSRCLNIFANLVEHPVSSDAGSLRLFVASAFAGNRLQRDRLPGAIGAEKRDEAAMEFRTDFVSPSVCLRRLQCRYSLLAWA